MINGTIKSFHLIQIKTNELGTIFHLRDGDLHREDGPAHIYQDGTQAWFRYGELHREDGPAFDRSDGYQSWYINGRRHREDGPAVIFPDGYLEFWLGDSRHDPTRDGRPDPRSPFLHPLPAPVAVNE